MMEVRLRPGVPGCITMALTAMTLGLLPILMRMGERHFVARMDNAGFESRAGARVAWADVQRVQRMVGRVQGLKMSDEFLLFTSQGRFSLPFWRIENAEEVMAFAATRLRHHHPQGQ